MVRLSKDQFGRGPNRVRTYWCNEDVLTTVLEDTLTPAERNLATLGEHERLRDTRMFFQYATLREFCEPVERLTGRTVRAFISGDRHRGRRLGDRDVHPPPGGLRRTVAYRDGVVLVDR
jgi:uncharacterized protein YbcI